MAELMFKRGLQKNLPSEGIDGCFYLTTDTNRLYVGQGNSKAPVLLNQTVQTVESVSALPGSPPASNNDFFYCIAENVLAIYRNEKWTQINTNTNDTVEVTGVEFGEGKIVGATDANSLGTAVEYTLTLNQMKYDLNGSALNDEINKINPITATLKVKTEDITKIIPEAAEVGLSASEITGGGAKINTQGSGSDSSKIINIVPGDNVDDISVEGNDIVIDVHDTTYGVSVEHVDGLNPRINITSSDDNVDNVYFKAGKDLVVSSEGVDTIVYAHKDYNVESTKVENISKLSPQDTLNLITGIEIDNGHITNVKTDSVTMPFDTHLVSGVNHTSDTWKASFTDNVDTIWEIDFSGDAKNLENDLKKYVDQGLAAANTALTYKGTISDPNDLNNKTNVEVGDVYLLNKNISTSDNSYRAGDLFIAVSKSGKAGVLTQDDLEWTYVPSGDELIIDTHFSGVATVNGKTGVQDNTNNGSASFHIEAQEDIQGNINTPSNNETLTLIAGNDLEIVNNTESGSKNEVATVRHRDIVTTNTSENVANDAFSVTAIIAMETDNGHVTDITTKQFNIPTYEMVGENNHIKLLDSADNVRSDILVSGDSWINAAVTKGENGVDALSIVHAGPNSSTTGTVVNNDSVLVQEGNLNIISGVHYDDKGHVTQVDTSTVTMPKDTTYDYYIGNSNGDEVTSVVNNPYLVLKDRHDNVDRVQMYSGNSSLTVEGNKNQVTFNLVWGSF